MTDDDANVSVFEKTLELINQGAEVIGLKDTTITPNDVIAFSFSASDVDGVAKILWDFGDGNTSTDENPTHSYTNDGVERAYMVTLTTTNFINKATSITKEVRVGGPS